MGGLSVRDSGASRERKANLSAGGFEAKPGVSTITPDHTDESTGSSRCICQHGLQIYFCPSAVAEVNAQCSFNRHIARGRALGYDAWEPHDALETDHHDHFQHTPPGALTAKHATTHAGDGADGVITKASPLGTAAKEHNGQCLPQAKAHSARHGQSTRVSGLEGRDQGSRWIEDELFEPLLRPWPQRIQPSWMVRRASSSGRFHISTFLLHIIDICAASGSTGIIIAWVLFAFTAVVHSGILAWGTAARPDIRMGIELL